jgi:ABC-type amino acid transport substrate-binding protein
MAGDMAPLNMTTKDGKVIGLEVDMAEAMAESMGVKLNVKTMPFGDLLGAMEAGTVDMVMSGMTITPKRNLKFAFAGPYLVSGKCLLTKEATIAAAKETAEINSPDTKLAALAGSTSQELVENGAPKAQLTTVKTYDEGIQMVLDGSVHAMVADYPLCAVTILRYPDEGLVSAFSLLSYEPLGIALPANDAHMLNWMENYIGALEGSGILDLLKLRWLEDVTWVDQLK